MLILGLNLFHADSSASIFIDGELAFSVAEERLNRKKHYGGFPNLSIQACLNAIGARLEDIDHVAVGRDHNANLKSKISFAIRHPKRLSNFARLRFRSSANTDLKTLISDHMDIDPAKLRFKSHNVEHHIAHASSSFYPSNFDKSAVFSFDGSGDFVSVMFARGQGNRLEPLRKLFLPNSLGNFYTAVCQFIGYSKYGDEGKVMGLAPYGKNTYQREFEDILQLTDSGFRLNPTYFRSIGSDGGIDVQPDGSINLTKLYTNNMREVFGNEREPYSELTARDTDLAFAMQRRFEDATFHLLRHLHRIVPETSLAIAGGCALNSVANGKIFQYTPFEKTWVQPAAGDEGLSIGAAMYVYHHILNRPRSFTMRHAFWGPGFSDEECKNALDKAKLAYRKLERSDLLEFTSGKLMNGAIVGWFQGRMEWGPRALGNRSILAHPGISTMKDTLNSRIKHRETFRPFAPSILKEYQDQYFEYSHPSPYMQHVFQIRPQRREELSAVTHVDGSGRLQSVSHDDNPIYYDLISSFHRRSGTPVLLNTSFNEDEPIVCIPEEAIDCFVRTKMDVLCLGPFVVEKNCQ